MDKKPKKHDDKNLDKINKDRGDKVNLLVRVFEELDIADFLPNRDRGDSKGNFRKVPRNIATELSSRNIASEPGTTYKVHPNEGNTKVAISTSEAKPKKQDFTMDSDDSSKKYLGRSLKKITKIEESAGKTTPIIVKNNKIKTENKARVNSEQAMKCKLEFGNTDDVAYESKRKIDEKLNENIKIKEVKRNDNVKNMHLPPGKDLKFIEKDALERRKLLRQRYTVKLKSSNKNITSRDSFKSDNFELKTEVNEVFDREKLNESQKDLLQIEKNKLGRRATELTQVQRKPIIKTIRNNDHRVYKAVTFIDQKETTPLQIKMPNSKKSVETNTIKNKIKQIASQESVKNIVKEKSTHTKKTMRDKKNGKRLKKRPPSTALTTCEPSLQTEVAKWAPSSVNQHTKPYYEAWVDTTLAAITKCSEEDKLQFNKQHIFKTFKRALEMDSRPASPHLIYENVNDEKFMGRITVNKSK